MKNRLIDYIFDDHLYNYMPCFYEVDWYKEQVFRGVGVYLLRCFGQQIGNRSFAIETTSIEDIHHSFTGMTC